MWEREDHNTDLKDQIKLNPNTQLHVHRLLLCFVHLAVFLNIETFIHNVA